MTTNSEKLIATIEESLKVGLIDILLLQQLSYCDMYGYQIREEIAKASENKIIIKDGSLYGPLHRMEKKKFITPHKKLVGERRFRIYYHLEDAGKKYLDAALIAFDNIFIGASKNFKTKD